MINPIFFIILTLLELYSWVIIAQVILSWLVAFQVINTNNQFVYSIGQVLYRLTEPLYRRLRPFIPDMGGLDLTPLVGLLVIFFLRYIIQYIGFQLAIM